MKIRDIIDLLNTHDQDKEIEHVMEGYEKMKEALLILKDFEGCLIYTNEMEDVVRWGLSKVDELPKVF